MNRIAEKLKMLSLSVKIQLVIAILFTAAIPVCAWFARQSRIEAMSKVKEPPSINLASGGDDPALYINLENIDVTKSMEQYVVFSVEPGKYPAYDIQLTRTTNIPFTYELYRVKETEDGTIEYIGHSDDGNGNISTSVLKYSKIAENALTLTNINPDNGTTGRVLGDENGLAVDRRNYKNLDTVDQYVKPLYSVARHIPKLTNDGSENRDYFALKMTWNKKIDPAESEYWNYAFNNKETDIVYISAVQNTPPNEP